MIAGDGGIRVEAPACRPRRYGLRSVAEVVQRPGFDWAKGFEWDEHCNSSLGVTTGQCPPLEEAHTKEANRGFGTSYGEPFIVYAGWDCSSGAMMLSEAWDNAQHILDRNWWRLVESVFWNGYSDDDVPIPGTLGANADVEILSDEAQNLTNGIAMLESYAADCSDCEPIIHGNAGVATYLAERYLIAPDGGQMRFVGTGSLLSAGGGYGTSGPPADESGESDAPLDPGEAWLYVTGGVNLTHSGTFFRPERGDDAGAVDRLVNDATVYAERFGVFQTGCCVGAVRVTLASCCCG